MASTDLAIRIATVLDPKGLNKAKKEVGGLEGMAKKLGKQLAGAFAVQKVLAFGKAAAEAFIKDQAEATKLAQAVKNLGLEFANPIVAQYVDNLSKMSGIADSELRPAFQALIQQTGDLSKSQELLSLAIEMSRGSGESLATTSNDLAQAFVGNTKGLKKYYLGLTQAELKTMSFADVQKKLNNQFSGSSAAYLKTYAGQMEVLKTAAGEAQETIGKGLVDGLALLADDGTAQGLADAMQSFADSISDAIYGLGSLAAEFKKVSAATPSWLKDLVINPALLPGGLGAAAQLYTELTKYGDKKYNQTLENPSTLMFKQDMANMRLNNLKVKDQKKILDATKKNTAELKKQQALKQAGLAMDMTTANLIAALKGNLSDEDRKRAELQLALATDNVTEAQRLTKEIALSQGLSVALANTLASLPAAKNPFAAWKGYLDEIELQAKRIAAFSGTGTGAGAGGNGGGGSIPDVNQVLAEASAGFASANQQIKILVEGGDEVTNLMRFKIQEAAQSGSTTNWSQTVGAWDR